MAIISCALSGSLSLASSAPTSIEGIQTYQKNIHLTPEKQSLVDDISRYRNADNLWDVLREEFTLPHYEDNPLVQAKIEWYMNNQDYLLRSANRAAPYLYYILQQIKKRHLPAELALLPIVESGYNPFSLSHMGAAGIWQLMPGTASDLGIRQDWWFDGRRDVIASTRGALNHLVYLESFFEGNWLLAIAAYNTGEGNVLSAMRRNIRDGRDTDFWSLPVAQETKDYVPSLLALAVIVANPDRYPVYFPPVRNAPYLGQIDVGKQINLKYAASLAGISYTKLSQLNPGYNRLSMSNKGPYKLILPIENVAQFTENFARTPLREHIDWIHYKTKPGDSLASITKKFNVSMTDIRRMNHLNLTKDKLKPGTNLLLPNNHIEVAEKAPAVKSIATREPVVVANQTPSAASSNKYTVQPGDTIYMTRNTDTLSSIAKRFRISTSALMAANGIHKQITPGTQLVIPTHLLTVAQQKPAMVPGDTIYMVRHGDTIEKIATKFHTTPAAVRLTNLVDNDSLSEGEKLVIPTHIRG